MSLNGRCKLSMQAWKVSDPCTAAIDEFNGQELRRDRKNSQCYLSSTVMCVWIYFACIVLVTFMILALFFLSVIEGRKDIYIYIM